MATQPTRLALVTRQRGCTAPGHPAHGLASETMKTTDTRHLFPLRFGDSAAVRAWEDRIAREELSDRARRAGLTLTGDPTKPRPGLARHAREILHPANFWPDAYERLKHDIRDLQSNLDNQ